MSGCVGIIFSHGKLLTKQTSFSGKVDKKSSESEAAYMVGVTESGCTSNQSSHSMDCTYTWTCTGVGAHTG